MIRAWVMNGLIFITFERSMSWGKNALYVKVSQCQQKKHQEQVKGRFSNAFFIKSGQVFSKGVLSYC